MLKPCRLREGATIGLISPASAAEPAKIDAAIANLQKRGFRVKEGRHIRSRYGYLAAPDSGRLNDLHSMFADPKVDAIMCVRGGYGTGRLAPFINYDLVRDNPKILIGFSDITFLHLAFLKMCDLVTFNGYAAQYGDPRSDAFGR